MHANHQPGYIYHKNIKFFFGGGGRGGWGVKSKKDIMSSAAVVMCAHQSMQGGINRNIVFLKSTCTLMEFYHSECNIVKVK